jgi:uncharacterized membrane protein
MDKQSNVNNIIQNSNALRVARTAIFAALSVIGSFITPYPPMATIAFDSSPGFFASLYFGAIDGAIITGLGHLATATIKGFPLGTLHFIIALGMALAGGAMGLINKTNKKWGAIPASLAAVAINTALAIIMVPSMGWAATFSMVAIPLLIASTLNAAIATVIYFAVRTRRITA